MTEQPPEHARAPADHRAFRPGRLFSSIPRASEDDQEHDRAVDRVVAAIAAAGTRLAVAPTTEPKERAHAQRSTV
jgi:hypothetical protein